MIDEARFATGMHALGAAFNRVVTGDVLHVYLEVLGARLDDAAWDRAYRRALEAETFFPPPSVLLRYGLCDATPPTALAGHAYAAIVAAFEDGRSLGYRDVLDSQGRAAAEAFVAAGGNRAFAWCEPASEPFRRRDFLQAYVEQVEADPILALPPGKEAAQLPPGESTGLIR
jgi:hypothetical protein